MSKGEIITCQVGHYSNFVGTHWWNLQEASFSFDPKQPSELNHDVLFREGRTRKGLVTYLPRLISVDLKSSLRSLKHDGCLYAATDRNYHPIWPGAMEIHKSRPTPKNEFLLAMDHAESGLKSEISLEDEDKDICQEQSVPTGDSGAATLSASFQLNDKIKVWSDFLCMHLHPRSINLIKEYTHQNESESFDIYHYGRQLTAGDNGFEGIESSIRYFAEECDCLQGFHLLVDADSGFAGVAANIASYLEDEFGNKNTLSIPLYDFAGKKATPLTKQCTIVNSMLCLEQMTSVANLVIPMSCFTNIWQQPVVQRQLKHLKYQANLPYHTSAILAASLDCATTPYRLKDGSNNIRDYCSTLNAYGRKIASLTVEFPLPLFEGVSVADSLKRLELDYKPVSLTPSFEMLPGSRCMSQNVTLRGLPANILYKPSEIAANCSTNKLETFEELLNWSIHRIWPSYYSPLCRIEQPCNVCDPFPHIFDLKMSQHGIICANDRPENTGVQSIPVMTGVHSDDGLHKTLEALLVEISSLNLKKMHKFTDAGLEETEFLNCIENLRQLSSCYEYCHTV